jgi:DNA polymerase III alpha subunit
VSVAGVVLVRQRPGSAKGVVFLTLEDEFGVANAVIWPQVLETHRAVVMGSRLMLIKGRVQRDGRHHPRRGEHGGGPDAVASAADRRRLHADAHHAGAGG